MKIPLLISKWIELFINSKSRIFQDQSPSESPTPRRISGGEVTLAISTNKNYGAIGGIEKVTYTWADINAFATENRSKSRRFWNFWKSSGNGMFQQRKQLLRNGMYSFGNQRVCTRTGPTVEVSGKSGMPRPNACYSRDQIFSLYWSN